MKLTWFGGTTLRIYAGGRIAVFGAHTAPPGIDRQELVAASDLVVGGEVATPLVDPSSWKPKPPPKAIDEQAVAPMLEVIRVADGTHLFAAPVEPPLVLVAEGVLPNFGRWADGAVIVLLDRKDLVAAATAILERTRPRLIALAADDAAVDAAIAALAGNLGSAGLVALEPGLALEV